jgi:hypothetical protein
LGDLVDNRLEHYSSSWAGKRNASLPLHTPSRATLMPAKDESPDFDIPIPKDKTAILQKFYSRLLELGVL